MEKKRVQDRILLILSVSIFVSFHIVHNAIVTLGIAMFLVLFKAMMKHGMLRIKIDRFFGALVCFWITCAISIIWATDTSLVIGRCTQLAELYICIFAVYLSFVDKSSIEEPLKVIMFGGYLTCLITVILFGFANFRLLLLSGERIYTETINSNTLGMLCANSITINLYFLLYRNEKKWWSIFLVPAVLIVAVSSSRKALLMAVLGLSLLLLFKPTKNKILGSKVFRLIITVICIVAIVNLIGSIGIFGGVTSRFTTFFNAFTGQGKVDYSTRARSELIRIGWDLFKQHPFGGVGIDNARIYAMWEVGRNYYLHNNFVEILADLGILGFIAYYSMYFYIFSSLFNYRQAKNHEFIICLILLLVELIMEYANVTYSEPKMYFMFIVGFLEVQILKANLNNNSCSKS